jgi:uncharacterized protein (DUF362 family)
MNMSRREFIRKMTALGFTVATASAIFTWLSCRPADTDMPIVTATTTPSATSPPTSSPVLSPTDTPTPTTPMAPTLNPAPPSEAPPTVIKSSGTYLSVARGQSPKAITEAAIRALGGIEQFVKAGDDVIIKPNICVAYHTFEYAATTNPEVVGTLVSLCKNAGAKRVRVMDQPFGGGAEQAYTRSGIGEAVRNAGGQMEIMSDIKFKDTAIPNGIDLKNWGVYSDVLEADVVINVPIAKHHNLARLTLGMKNLMGVIQNRNQIHFNIGQRLADLTSLIRPTLTVVDCVRILMNNGPTGGDLADVKLTNTVIASPDIVAADAYATTLFGLTGADIPYIRTGAQMGLGIMDLRSVKVEEINV